MIARNGSFRWRAPVIAVVVLCSMTASSLVVTPASADPLSDKRAEAHRLASEIDSLGERVSILAEDLDAARLESDGLAARVAVATRDLAAAEQVAAGARTILSQAAVTTYMRSGVDRGVGQSDLTGASVDPLLRRQYAMTIDGRRVDALDEMRAQLKVLSEKRAALARAQKDASAAVASVEKAQRASEQAGASEQAALAKVKGDLVGLVQEEEARLAAEQAANAQRTLARADAEARKQAAQQASSAATAPARPGGPKPGPTKPGPAAPGGNGASNPTVVFSTPAPSAGAQAAIEEARRQLGKPYSYGAAGPDSFDCSGLTMWSWRAGGRGLPHSAQAQYSAVPHVSPSSAQPGDLFFYGSPIHHVAIYIGNGQIIEAAHTGTNVRVAGAYRSDLVGVGRP